MPELPEVETIRRILEPQLKDARILHIQINNEKIIAAPGVDDFVKNVQGQTISSMERRGKFLIFNLGDAGRLVLHLRMTGRILAVPGDFPEEKHTHVIMELSTGAELRYMDTRRFGRFWYVAPDGEGDAAGMNKLGIEPDSRELSPGYLKLKLGNRRKAIKEMLHEQSVIAGIGNIYSDEILFDAGIYPGKKCNELADEEWERLAVSIPQIIAWGIESDQMTPEEYLAGKGREYGNIEGLRVYGRHKEACRRCNSAIERITIGGRSSHYCPRCQRLQM